MLHRGIIRWSVIERTLPGPAPVAHDTGQPGHRRPISMASATELIRTTRSESRSKRRRSSSRLSSGLISLLSGVGSAFVGRDKITGSPLLLDSPDRFRLAPRRRTHVSRDDLKSVLRRHQPFVSVDHD